jgi:Xaa-Pro aminopeptidase
LPPVIHAAAIFFKHALATGKFKKMNDSVTPFLKQRIAEFQQGLAGQKLKGLILDQPATIFYLTGWLPPSWAHPFLVISSIETVLVSPFLPKDIVPVWGRSILYTSLIETVQPDQEARQALMQALSELGLQSQRIGCTLQTLPAAYILSLAPAAKLEDASTLIYSLTAIKDELAQSEIRKRVAMLDRAFETAAHIIQAGMTEIELYGHLYADLASALGSPFGLDCNLGSGWHSVVDEPQPTSKKLQKGETVLIDLFPNLGGYVADYTRNFIVGPASPEQQKQHGVLESALAAAERLLRPGVSAAEIDHTVRAVIEEAGYGDFIYHHHTGHAFGVTTPEPPVIIPGNPARLQSGMVIAIEPGIYHPVNGGMRLEGNYLITEDGCEALHGFKAKLTSCL